MNKLKAISLVAGTIGVLISLISLSLSQRELGKASRESRTQQWQAVAVYSIIDRGGADGSSFEDIKSMYLDAAQQFAEYEIPKSSISDESLKRVLLDLISGRAVVPVGGSKYRVAYEPYMNRDPNIKFGQRMMDVSRQAAFYVTTEPNHYTVDALVTKLEPEFPDLNATDLRMIISDGIRMKFLVVNQDKKLSPGN